MEIKIKSKINGACEGFKKNRIFELSNGQKWRQMTDRDTTYESRNLMAQILVNKGRHYLEIAGMGKAIEVELFS